MQETVDSPWAVLGLDEGATLAEVRRAFRARAKTTHPDHGGSRAEFEALRAAFEAARRLAVSGPDLAPPTATPTPPPQPSRPRHRPAPGVGEWRVPPAPPRVVNAYDWAPRPAPPFTAPRRRVRVRNAAESVAPATTATAFAAVLDGELARLGVPA